MESAGVFDVWFEPVYREEPKEQPFKKGDWVIGEFGEGSNTWTYVGIYESNLRMSGWVSEALDIWMDDAGDFHRITRIATPEEISIAKTYKYAAQIKEIRNKADKEIQALLK